MKILKTLHRVDTLDALIDNRYQTELLKNAELRSEIETSRTNNAKLFNIKHTGQEVRGTIEVLEQK
jgi:hypothetical protein